MNKENRFFDLKMSLLFCWLFATGLLMAVLGPYDTLDIHLYYSQDYAQNFLRLLSDTDVRAYLYNESLDFMFMAVYALIFLMAMKKAGFPRKYWLLVFVPLLLDVWETSVIYRALLHPDKTIVISFLGEITFLKWMTGALLALWILVKIFKKQRAVRS